MSEALSFGAWLKQRRRTLDLTQERVARQAACSVSTLRKLESDDLLPSKELAALLAAALQVPEAERTAFITFARNERSSIPISVPTIVVGRTGAIPATSDLTTMPIAVGLPWQIGQPLPAAAAPIYLTHTSHQDTLTAPSIRPYRLPAQVTALIGREWELLTAQQLLQQPGVRLLTLTGPPGTGKTRLALALAEALRDHFRDGVCFVPLAALSEAALVLPTIARALGVTELNALSLQVALLEFLQTKELLLVVDNFEHVVAAAEQLTELLQAAARVKLLVTSQTLLKVYGEHEFVVPPLPLPDLQRLPAVEEVMRYPAVTLFVQRARAVQPSFHLTAENVSLLVQICARLDGLPLALEMAAARIKLHSPALILKQLRKRSSDLTSGLRNLAPRQQTLQNAIAWSYALLGPGEQALFNLLGVFVGGSTLNALDAICTTLYAAAPAPPSQAEVEQQLQALIDHSLLQVQINHEGATRYTMLETLREYAGERLQCNQQWHDAKRAHATYFAQLAAQAAAHFQGHEQRLWLTTLEQEHDNLRSALFWCQEHQILLGLQIATDLSEFWFARSYLAEGSGQIIRLLAQPTAPTAGIVRARALCAAGYLVERQGNYTQAQAMIEESLLLCQSEADQVGVAKALHNLGVVAFYQNDYAQAQRYYEEALLLYRAFGDLAAMAGILRNLGLIAKDQCDYAQANRYLEDGLAVAQQLGNPYILGRIYNGLALVTFWQGEFERSARFSNQSLALHQQLGDKQGVGHALENLGAILYRRRDFVAATRHINECLALFQEINDKVGILSALDDLGLIAADQGDLLEAAGKHRESLLLAWQIKEKRYMAFSLERLAAAVVMMEKAVTLYSAAAALRTTIGAPSAPIDQARIATRLDALRNNLGESVFASLWREGPHLLLEQVVTLALQA